MRIRPYEERAAIAERIEFKRCYFCGRLATWMTVVPGWSRIRMGNPPLLPEQIPSCTVCRGQAFEVASKYHRLTDRPRGYAAAYDAYYTSREAGERAMAPYRGC